MESKDVFLLENIIGFCEGIERAVARFGDDYRIFDGDLDYQDACEMKIVQMGENVADLSEGFKEQHPEIPWRNIVGTRNIIVHDYGVLSSEKVWETIKNDIPRLKDFCLQQIEK